MSSLRVIPASTDLVRFLAARFSSDQLAALHRADTETMLQGIEADVRDAARTWCIVDDGGPVFMLGAMAQPCGTGAHLWYLTSAAAEDHTRACIRLWHRAVTETLAEFGSVRVDVPPYIAIARRMRRYGFAVSPPARDTGGTIVCQCEMIGLPQLSGGMFHNTTMGI